MERKGQWSDPRGYRRRPEEPAEARTRSRSSSNGPPLPQRNLHETIYHTPTKQRDPTGRSSPGIGRQTRDDDNVEERLRRVQFTKKLEVTKTPPVAKTPILRVKSRGGNQTNQAREPDGATVKLSLSDPPTNVSKDPLFSPKAQPKPLPFQSSLVPKNQGAGSRHFPMQSKELPPTPSRNTSRRAPFTDSRVQAQRSRQHSHLRSSSASPVRPSRLLSHPDYRTEQSETSGRIGIIPPFRIRQEEQIAEMDRNRSLTPVQPRHLQGTPSRTLPPPGSTQRSRQSMPHPVPHGRPTAKTPEPGQRSRPENSAMASTPSTGSLTERISQTLSTPDQWNIVKYITESVVERTPKTNNHSNQNNKQPTVSSPWTQDAHAILADLSRQEPVSPASETSTDSESEFLISKYTPNSSRHSRNRPAQHVQKPKSASKLYRLTSPLGRRNKKETEDKFFSKKKKPRVQLTSFHQELASVDSMDKSYDFDILDLLNKKTTSTDDTDVEGEGEWNFSRNAPQWKGYKEDFGDESEGDDNYLISYERKESKRRRPPTFFFLCLMLCCLGAGLPVYLLVFHDNKEDSAQEVDSSTCATYIQGNNNFIFSSRYEDIRQLLTDSVVNTSNIDIAESPQRKALCWLADFDSRELDSESNLEALVQRYTLGVLFFALADNNSDDPRSLKNTNFLSGAHECDWGVTMCNALNSVTALLLSDTFLQGALPDDISNLPDLTFLDLSLNEITGSIPSSIEKLTMLEYLSFAFNSLTGTLPSELGTMNRLQFLNMRSSKVQGTIPNELGNLKNLETLLLEGNWLTGTIPKSLGNLHKAKQFSFRKNYFEGKVAESICGLREESLEELKVDSWVDCDCCTK